MDEARFEGAIVWCQLDLGPGIRVIGDPPEAEGLDVGAHLACRARQGRLNVYFLGRQPERWPENYWLPGENTGVLFRPMDEVAAWMAVMRSAEPVNLVLEGVPPFGHRVSVAFHRE